jgi:O-antigen/teichoic acid export membrane protein
LILGELINAGVGLVGNIIIMSGRPKVALFNAGINFLSIVLLCLFMIPEYGIMGAAFSYAITVALVNLIRLLELYYFEKMHPFKTSFVKPIIAGAIAFALVYPIKNFISLNQYVEMVLGTMLFLLLFVLILWILKFDDEDKYIFSLITGKLKRKEG